MYTQEEKEAEYWQHVSSQDELPIIGKNLLPDLTLLDETFEKISKTNTLSIQKQIVQNAIIQDPKIFGLLRLFVGIADKRAYLDLSYIFRNITLSDGKTTLCGCTKKNLNAHQTSFFLNMIRKKSENAKKATEVITNYLCEKGLLEILLIFSRLNTQKRNLTIQRIIFPREFQQSEAKRRGHGSEGRFAKLVKELGCEILPPDKDVNPMGSKDIRLDKKSFEIKTENTSETRSYDLVILDNDNNIRIGVIGLIHSSDPGEYGVAKADRTSEYKDEMNVSNIDHPTRKISLCAILDGVGFAENKKDTVNKILKNVDCFVQIKSLYKIGLYLHQIGLCKIEAIQFERRFFTDSEIEKIKKEYVSDEISCIKHDNEIKKTWKKVDGGMAFIFVKNEE